MFKFVLFYVVLRFLNGDISHWRPLSLFIISLPFQSLVKSGGVCFSFVAGSIFTKIHRNYSFIKLRSHY